MAISLKLPIWLSARLTLVRLGLACRQGLVVAAAGAVPVRPCAPSFGHAYCLLSLVPASSLRYSQAGRLVRLRVSARAFIAVLLHCTCYRLYARRVISWRSLSAWVSHERRYASA